MEIELMETTDRILQAYGLHRNPEGVREGDLLPSRETVVLPDGRWRAGLIVRFARALGTDQIEYHVIYTGNPGRAGKLYVAGGFDGAYDESEIAYKATCQLAYLLDR